MIVDLATYTTIHTALSLVALASGIIVVIGLIGSKSLPMWNALFLATAFATSATGFGFPFTALLPSHGVAMVALVVLALTMLAYYGFGLSGETKRVRSSVVRRGSSSTAASTSPQAALKAKLNAQSKS